MALHKTVTDKKQQLKQSISIKWRLMFSCVAIVLIPIFIQGIFNYNSTRNQIIQQTEDLLQQQSKIIKQNVRNTYALAKQKVESDLNVARYIVNKFGVPRINEKKELTLIDLVSEKRIQQQVEQDLNIAHSFIYNQGQFKLDKKEKFLVKIVNQVTKENEVVEIPTFRHASKKIAFNYELVDSIKSLTRVESSTLFQVIPQGLLRISTNVKKRDGSRAVGTYIPTDSIVYKTIIQGRTYKGRAYVVNAWYKTAYEPISDDQQNVIGVLYVGVKERPHVINNNFEIVDTIRDNIGGTATIFQLRDFDGAVSGDATSQNWVNKKAMYRISTNVKKTDGSRAVGTILSKKVYDVIMSGKTFYGRAWVVNQWYLTAYEPLKDEQAEIVGILYVGVQESIFQEVLKNMLVKLKMGKSGYVYILNDKGEFVLSFQREKDGSSGWNFKDADGNYVFQEIIKKSLSLKADETAFHYYSWKNKKDAEYQDKVCGFSYFPEWNWTIASTVNVDDYNDTLNDIILTTLIICLLAILFAVVVSYLISISFTKPIQEIISFIGELKESHFGNRLEINRLDETGVIKESMNEMADNLQLAFQNINEVMKGISEGDMSSQVVIEVKGDLNELKNRINSSMVRLSQMMTDVITSTEEVQNGAAELSNAAQVLAEGTVQQTDSIQVVTGSMQQVADQAKTNEENASLVKGLTHQAQEEVANGNEQMSAMLQSMKEITTTSNNVEKVITVIDGIASQTSLLAINAAIEAQRAGEFGKGFAVVATEVKTLAERSAQAAKDTKKLIQASLAQVSDGSQNADATADILSSISESILKISDIIETILTGSSQQASNIDEIDKGLSRVNLVVDQNASISEENAAASEEVSSQATELQGIIRQFKLLNDDSSKVVKTKTSIKATDTSSMGIDDLEKHFSAK